MLQDRKYEFRDGQIVNRASGEVIPADEPVFVFRARDRNAAFLLKRYQEVCVDADHQKAIEKRIEDFEKFAKANPDRMKEPDTDINSSDWE